MLHSIKIFSLLVFCFLSVQSVSAESHSKKTNIASGLFSVDVKHNGKVVTITRNQDKNNEIVDFYKKTARGTVQPMQPFAPHDVETLGEIEVLDYMKKMSDGDDSIILVDSRTNAWVERTGVIPGAVSIPLTKFKTEESTLEVMEDHLNVTTGEVFDFRPAKTIVMYCNGNWCGQSPTAIKKLLAAGYPAAKIKYYRGGMQSWTALGLTLITDTESK